MIKKRLLLLAMVVSINMYVSLEADSWKVLFYMDSSDGLSDMAIKNITDMVRGQVNDTVDFVVQLHAYGNAGLRYRVSNGSLIFLQEVALSGDSKVDLIDASTWAFGQTDADYTMLILSNHGWGILDPQWNEETQKWQAGMDSLSNSCMMGDACPLKKRVNDQLRKCGNSRSLCNESQNYYQDRCSEGNSYLFHEIHRRARYKGFMFSANPHTYLTNQDLVDSLAHIKQNVLHGHNLDILAFDTCMGNMFEIAYLVAPHVSYLVGNQSCALVDGFDYQGVVRALNQGFAPRQLATQMVRVFDDYYSQHDDSGIYTHAALDLSYVYEASKALDNVVLSLLNIPEFAPYVVRAYTASPSFCMWPMYSDVIAFCKCLELQIGLAELQGFGEDNFSGLKAAIQDFYQHMQAVIVARCGGSTTQERAFGTAIYLPTNDIDVSYYTTAFARESGWIKLLQMVVDCRKQNLLQQVGQ